MKDDDLDGQTPEGSSDPRTDRSPRRGRRRRQTMFGLPRASEIAGLFAALVAVLFAVLGACLYFFNRLHAEAFLEFFDLGPGVLPVSTQDAVANGTKAFILGIFDFWKLAVVIVLPCVLLPTLFRFTGWDRTRRHRRLPRLRFLAKGMRRLRADPRSRTRLILTLLFMVLPVVILMAALLIAFPADKAARGDACRFYRALENDCPSCTKYRLRGTELKGLLIGSTPERLFVLSSDRIMHPLKIDDVETITVGAPATSHADPSAAECSLLLAGTAKPVAKSSVRPEQGVGSGRGERGALKAP